MNEYKIYYSANVKQGAGYYKYQKGELLINTYKSVLTENEFQSFIDKKLIDYQKLNIDCIIKNNLANRIVDSNKLINTFFEELELIDNMLEEKKVNVEKLVIELYGKLVKIPYNHSIKAELSKENDKFQVTLYYPRFNKEEISSFKSKLEIAKIIGFLYLYTDIFIGSECLKNNEECISFVNVDKYELKNLYEEKENDDSIIDFALILLLPTPLINTLSCMIDTDSLDEKADIINNELNIEKEYILRRLYLDNTLNFMSLIRKVD